MSAAELMPYIITRPVGMGIALVLSSFEEGGGRMGVVRQGRRVGNEVCSREVFVYGCAVGFVW